MSRKLRFVFGNMGSSKSLRLLAMAHNFEEKGIDFVILKPSIDNRDGEDIVKSRAGLERKCIGIDDTFDIFNYIREYNSMLLLSGNHLKWILIDECQFLTEKQVDELSDIVDYLDIDVMCYGLRTDFNTKLFPASKRLFEIADEFEEIKSYCSCGENKTLVNSRISEDGEISTNGEQILIGGDEIYKSICRKCWKKKIKQKK